MLSALFNRLVATKPAQAPVELSGTVGGVLIFYRSEIDGLAKWARSMGQKGVKARPRDTEAESWAAIGLTASHLAGMTGDRVTRANDPEQVVPIVSAHFALGLAVFKALSDPFIDRGLVNGANYAGEMMSTLRGFVEGATLLATSEQRGEVVSLGASMFSRLAEHRAGLVFLDFIASAAHNWAAATAQHDGPSAEKALETMALFASQISSIADALPKDAE